MTLTSRMRAPLQETPSVAPSSNFPTAAGKLPYKDATRAALGPSHAGRSRHQFRGPKTISTPTFPVPPPSQSPNPSPFSPRRPSSPFPDTHTISISTTGRSFQACASRSLAASHDCCTCHARKSSQPTQWELHQQWPKRPTWPSRIETAFPWPPWSCLMTWGQSARMIARLARRECSRMVSRVVETGELHSHALNQ